MRGDVQGVAGAVIEPADDLHVGAWGAVGFGESVVGEVGLPSLVGHRRLEADVGGFRALAWFGGDQASLGQVAGDGRPGDEDAVVVVEVPGDGVWAGVESGGIELGAEFVD
ncbi:MAG: hypothetical protein WKF73_20100 [Nocardioidaceae bacterium]